MGNISIIEAFEDSKIFGSLVRDQKTWANWKVCLKAIFGLPMDQKELKTYREFTGRKKPPKGPFKETFLVVGRRGGKSFISAVIAVFLAVFKDWRQYLRPGEIGYIMTIASDRKQATVILNYIRAILRLPIFKGLVQNDTREEIELSNQVTISVVTCSYRALRGYTVVAALCDEIAFWRAEGANPAKEILTALRPSLATVPGSLLLALSTPYSRTGPLYESFRDRFGKNDPETLVWKAPTKAMNPTIQDRVINKALKEDYSAAKAEWLAEFREDLEALLSTEMIEDAIVPRRWELPRIDEAHYYAFTDPSGGRADSYTLAIAHKDEDSDKVVLDRIEERRPPFNPQVVTAEFSAIIKTYGLSEVTGDKYAGEWVKKEFESNGISYKASEKTKSEIYLEFEPLLAQGGVELLDNKTLLSQLRSLERRTRPSGKDSVDSSPGLHDDVANAVAGACTMASGLMAGPQVRIWFLLRDDDEPSARELRRQQRLREKQDQENKQ